jgi:hypothetical protein
VLGDASSQRSIGLPEHAEGDRDRKKRKKKQVKKRRRKNIGESF